MSKEIKSDEKYREYDLNKSTCFFSQFSLTFTQFKKKKKIAIFCPFTSCLLSWKWNGTKFELETKTEETATWMLWYTVTLIKETY